jgi:uncharacterized protein YndB with AHSA1/START domain
MTQSLDLTWPPQPVTPSLTKVVTAVQIACTPERAFAYATNASLWHTWHPATAQVRDVNARPLGAGETIHESIVAIGQKFDALWTVLACEAPHLWVIATRTERGSARIVYRVLPHALGCEFIALWNIARISGRGAGWKITLRAGCSASNRSARLSNLNSF